MKLWLSSSVFIIAGIAGTAFSQTFQNGDFEAMGADNTPVGWTTEVGKFTCDSVKKHAGKYAGKLDGAMKLSAAYQDVEIQPGETYLLTGVWRNGDHTAAFDVARANVRWLTAPGGKDIGNAAAADSGDTVASWNRFQVGPVKAPQQARGARIRLSSSFGICAFDDLEWNTADSSTIAPPTPAPERSRPAEANVSAGAGEWMSSIAEGQRAARASSKRILIFFTTPNHGNSDYFEKNVFPDPGIRSALDEDYIRVRLDMTADAEAASSLKVKQPGTLLIFDSNGRGIDRIEERLPVAVIEKRLRAK